MSITTPVLSYLQNSEKILPMLLIEAPTTGGRAYQGYKRGGKAELREKLCEESLAAVFWLFGAKMFNKIGDFIGKNIMGLKDLDTDVGKDSLRNPFENIQHKKGLTAGFKFTKIVASAAMATLVMGCLVPKIKMAMTNAFRMQSNLPPIPDKKSPDGKFHPTWADKLVGNFIKYDKNMLTAESQNSTSINSSNVLTFDKFKNQVSSNNNPSFKGASLLNGLLFASHNLENNTAWRLLSTDVGTTLGRVSNSRTKKEAIEYGVRDTISSLFYVFAAPISSTIIRKMTKTPDINPNGAEETAKHLIQSLGENKTSVANNFFSSKFLSKDQVQESISEIKFKPNGTITLADFNAQTNGVFANKAELMSKLQPQLNIDGVKTSILSTKQVSDIMSDSELSDPTFLKKAILKATNGKSDSPKAFVSRKRLEGIRDSFDDFVVGLEKFAKNKTKNGEITEDIINKYTKHLNRKNLLIHMAGVGVAVFGLAYAIPKFQYWISEKLTGDKSFAGDGNNNQQNKTN